MSKAGTLPRKTLDKLIAVAERRLGQAMTTEQRARYADILGEIADTQPALTQARADRLRAIDRLATAHWDRAMALEAVA